MVPSVTGKKIAHSLPEAARRDLPLQRAKEKVVGSGEINLMVKDVKVHRTNYPIVEVYNDGSKNQTSHMKVPPGYAVLDCGAAKSLCGAKLVAQMAQTCAREGKRVGDKRDTEAIDESYHFRGIGNQIVSSFMKLRVPGSIDGKEVSFSPSVTPGDISPLVGNDHLIPWCCSIHLYPDECRLEIPSCAKLLVTTSNHILVNLADFEGMDEPDCDVWTSKRGRDSEETGTESDMTEGTEETITDPEEVPAKREFRERETTSSIHSIESSVAIRIEKIAACSCERLIGIGS